MGNVAAAESRSLAGDCRPSLASPSQRRARMAKSLSQDTGCCLTEATTTSLPSSTSDSALNNKVAPSPSPIQPLSPHLRAIPNPLQLSEVEESCSASDTGSCTDLTEQDRDRLGAIDCLLAWLIVFSLPCCFEMRQCFSFLLSYSCWALNHKAIR